MTENESAERTVAVCSDCEEAYAVWAWPDGRAQVIGRHDCGCGSNNLVLVEPSVENSAQ